MNDNILAGEPGEHCVVAVKHVGEPKGTIEIISGVETYVSMPPKGEQQAVIIFYADVWGPFFINNKLVQDFFASQGFVVVGLDYFEGDPIYLHTDEEGFDRPGWFAKKTARARVLVPKWLEAVKQLYPNKKFYAVGYCFGAPFVCEAGAVGDIAAGAIAHPASLNDDHFRKLNVPLLLSCAEIDHTFPIESRRKAEDILVEHKKTYHFQVFSGVKHGFALRGDPAVENERWAKEECARGVIGWFKRFL